MFILFKKNSAINGSVLCVLDQGILSLSNFISGIIIARTLGPEGFGVYSLYLSALMFMSGLQNALITGPIRVLGVRLTKDAGSYFNTQLILQYVLGIIIGFLTVIILRIFTLGNYSLIFSFSSCIFFWQLMELIRVINLTRFSLKMLFIIDLLVHSLRILMLSFLIYKNLLNIFSAFVVLSVSCIIGILVFYSSEAGINIRERIYLRKTLVSNWKYGKWLLLETLVYSVSTQVYLYLTALWVDTKSVGALSAVQNILNVFNVVLLGMISFATPVARKKLITFGYSVWKRWFWQVGLVLTLSSTGIGIVATSFARPLLVLIYSNSFAEYAYLVPICATTLCFKAVNTVLSSIFRTALFPEVGFYAKLVSAVLTVIISYPLLTRLGVAGTAIGLLFTQLLWTAVYYIYLKMGTLSKNRVMERLGAKKAA